MNYIFGRPKKAAAPAAPADFSAQRANMNTRAAECTQKIAEIDQQLLKLKPQLAAAKTPGALQGLRQQAMLLLKRKRTYEQQRGTVQQTEFNLDQMAHTIQTTQDAKITFELMKQAKVDMKRAQGELPLGELEDLHEDMAELMVDANEIAEVMSRDYGVGADVNEDELNAELEGLDAELAGLPDEMPSDAVGAGGAAVPAELDPAMMALMQPLPTNVPSMPVPPRQAAGVAGSAASYGRS